jgi:hypothetical protein
VTTRAGQRRSRVPRGAAAIATSVALHVLLVLLVRRLPGGGPGPAPAPEEGSPLEVEITLDDPRPTEADEPPAAVPGDRPARAHDAQKRGRSATPGEAGQKPTAPRRLKAAGAKPAAKGAGVPAARDDTSPLLRMRRGLPSDLALGYDTVDRLVRGGLIAGAPESPAEDPAVGGGHRVGEEAGAPAGDHIAEMLKRDLARGKVEVGRVHPQLYDYLRDAEARFNPTLALVEQEAGSPDARRTVRAWWQSYRDSLERLSRPEDRAGRRPFAPEKGRGLPPFSEAGSVARAPSRAAVELACEVCVVVRPNEAPRIELRRSSGSAAFDRMAQDALRRSTDRRPVPADMRPERACYRFAAQIQRRPPSLDALVGCSFDEVNLKLSCGYPLKKMFRTSVTLLGVEDLGG